MLIMIIGGMSLRNANLFNPVYLGTFYLGLGSALLLSGIMFIISGINFKRLNLT